MKKFFKIVGVLLALVCAALIWPAYTLYGEMRKAASEDPLVWEEAVAALEAETTGVYGEGEAVVFVGSSSIRFWRTLAEDMAPIKVLRHGFGGAKLNDVVYYTDRLVSNYAPRAVVMFAGTNDLHPGRTKPPQVLLESFKAFVRNVRAAQPDVPIFFIAITPSVMRWEIWDMARDTNALISDWSRSQPGLYVIDTAPALLSAEGEPDPENYIFDGLHLSERGYRIWTQVIKPPLLEELGLQVDSPARR